MRPCGLVNQHISVIRKIEGQGKLAHLRHFGSEGFAHFYDEMNPPEFSQLTDHHLVLALDASMAKFVDHIANLFLLL